MARKITDVKKEDTKIPSFKVSLKCKNQKQKELVNSIKNNQITICKGIFGTGKSSVIGATVLNLLKATNDFEKIICITPTVEVGDMHLGLMPGNLEEKMNFHKTLLLLSFLVVAMLCISSVAASEDDIGGNLTSDSSYSIIQSYNNPDCLETSNENNSTLSSPQTIIVEEIEDDHNEMSQPTIQKAIDSANAGDTIIVEGKSYVHCHFIINKKLTIKSNVGTTMEVCSSTQGSGYKGIFTYLLVLAERSLKVLP